MFPHSSQAPRDEGDLQPKHRVFLSHSGAQKGFVEQLCKDLEGCDRFPFFDKRRDSLPIGEPFPPLIYKAIQQCQVGVVILSEDFIISKWPMFELVEMVKTTEERPDEMKIMPIFLSISCGDLGSEENLSKWEVKWAEFSKDERISILEWKSALKLVRKTNGLVYKPEVGEVKFREEIVEEICKIVPPFHMWDDSHVQGRSRLSECIRAKICCGDSYGVVGLYGVGGIGKSTACKSLCKDFNMEFHGRVCHVEFGNDTTEESRLQAVLMCLSDTSNEYFKDSKKDEWWDRLKNIMHLQRVFLAIDNVSDNSMIIEEVEKYLNVGYCRGSIVMVTARGLGELRNVGIGGSDCLEMPELEVDEARALFVYHAHPKTEVEKEVLLECINRCRFSKGDGCSVHYHPLALKVLGSQLASKDPKEWKLQLKMVHDIFNLRRERENPVFSILRRSFDELMDEDKLIFMDVALFDMGDDYKRNGRRKIWNTFDWLGMVHGCKEDVVKQRLSGLKRKSLLEELGDGTTQIGMHDLWREFAVIEIERGERNSRRWVSEFLEGEAEDSSLSSGGWNDLQRISLVGREGWNGPGNSVKCLNFSDCSKLTVLKLVSVRLENNVVDLSPLRQLKSLEIAFLGGMGRRDNLMVSGIGLLTNLTVLIWFNLKFATESVVEEVSGLTNLQVLLLRFDFENTSTKLDLGQLRYLRKVKLELHGGLTISGLSSRMTNLRVVDLRNCYKLRSCPGVEELIGLEELVLHGCRNLKELPNLQKLTRLRILDIWDCNSLTRLAGLGSLAALQELRALSCGKLEEVPGLSRLTNLEVLDLSFCKTLKYNPGMCNFTLLRRFYATERMLKAFPEGSNLTKLQDAVIYGGTVDQLAASTSEGADDSSPQVSLRPVLDLALLESVSTLHLIYVDHELTNLSKLTRLQDLTIHDCSFKSLSGVRNLTALKILCLHHCRLERLPDMGNHMGLESLSILYCWDLEGWDGVGRLRSSESQTAVDLHCDWTLPHLEILEWVNFRVVELPDLSHFPRLRELKFNNFYEDGSCFGRTAVHCLASHALHFAVHCRASHALLEILHCEYLTITELPDLSKFPCLKELKVSHCHGLTSLSSSGPCTALQVLHLKACWSLEELPDVDLLSGLRDFYMLECRVTLNVQVVDKLRARCPRVRVDKYPFESEPMSDSESSVLAPDGTIDPLQGLSTSLEGNPSSGEFIPFSDPNCELALIYKRRMEQDRIDINERFKKHGP